MKFEQRLIQIGGYYVFLGVLAMFEYHGFIVTQLDFYFYLGYIVSFFIVAVLVDFSKVNIKDL